MALARTVLMEAMLLITFFSPSVMLGAVSKNGGSTFGVSYRLERHAIVSSVQYCRLGLRCNSDCLVIDEDVSLGFDIGAVRIVGHLLIADCVFGHRNALNADCLESGHIEGGKIEVFCKCHIDIQYFTEGIRNVRVYCGIDAVDRAIKALVQWRECDQACSRTKFTVNSSTMPSEKKEIK